MSAPFSSDLRIRIVNAAKTMSYIAVAKLFQVSRVSVGKYVKMAREGKSLDPKTGYQKGHSHKLDLKKLKDFFEKNPTTTLKNAGEYLGISIKTTHKGLRKLGITKKKDLLNILKETKSKELNLLKK